MAFKCTVDGELFHADHFREGEEFTVLCPVGYLDDQDVNFFVQVGLAPMASGECEYFFFVIMVNGATKQETPIYSGINLPDVVDAQSRRHILSIVLSATEVLLTIAKPKKIFRCTHDANPPEKALEKHYLVTKVFEHLGYEVCTSDQWYGKRCWWAHKKDDTETQAQGV